MNKIEFWQEAEFLRCEIDQFTISQLQPHFELEGVSRLLYQPTTPSLKFSEVISQFPVDIPVQRSEHQASSESQGG